MDYEINLHGKIKVYTERVFEYKMDYDNALDCEIDDYIITDILDIAYKYDLSTFNENKIKNVNQSNNETTLTLRLFYIINLREY